MTTIKRFGNMRAGMVLGALFGMFGARHFGEPSEMMDPQEITGSRHRSGRSGAKLPKGTAPRVAGVPIGFGASARAKAKQLYATMTREGYPKPNYPSKSHMGRGSEWIKENRRRRACGMPQLRMTKYGVVTSHDGVLIGA